MPNQRGRRNTNIRADWLNDSRVNVSWDSPPPNTPYQLQHIAFAVSNGITTILNGSYTSQSGTTSMELSGTNVAISNINLFFIYGSTFPSSVLVHGKYMVHIISNCDLCRVYAYEPISVMLGLLSVIWYLPYHGYYNIQCLGKRQSTFQIRRLCYFTILLKPTYCH